MNIEKNVFARACAAIFALGFAVAAAACSAAPEGDVGTAASGETVEHPAAAESALRAESPVTEICKPNPNVCENKGCGEFNNGCGVVSCGTCGNGLCINLGAQGTECLCPSGEHYCPSESGHGGTCTRGGCSIF